MLAESVHFVSYKRPFFQTIYGCAPFAELEVFCADEIISLSVSSHFDSGYRLSLSTNSSKKHFSVFGTDDLRKAIERISEEQNNENKERLSRRD